MAYEEPLYDPDSPPRADVTIAYGGPVAPIGISVPRPAMRRWRTPSLRG